MHSLCKTLLIAAGLVLCSPLLCAAESVASSSTSIDAVPTAWPIAPPGRPFERELSPEDIPSVQVPANELPQIPAVLDLTTAPTSLPARSTRR